MCEGTAIKTSRGSIFIENVEPREDFCLSYLDSGHRIHTEIDDITVEYKNFIALIFTEKGMFPCDLDQLLFDGSKNKYVPAKYISKNSYLVDDQLESYRCLSNTIVKYSTHVYRMVLSFSHNFFITEYNFLAHDAFPFSDETTPNYDYLWR